MLFIFSFDFCFRVFIYWVVRELFLTKSCQIIFGLRILWQCTNIHPFIFSKQIFFIKHSFQNYYKKVFLDFNFNCHGNRKPKSNQWMQ